MGIFRQAVNAVLAPFRALFRLPVVLLSTPRRIAGLSLPARIALLTFVLLVTIVVTLAILFKEGDGLGSLLAWLSIWEWIVVGVLIAVIPFFVYKTIQYWLEGEPPAFPDIEDAWQAGMQALAQERLDLRDLPLYIVLGLRDEKQVMSLFAGSGINFRVRHVPDGPAALHWYANNEAIFLACTSVGYLSRLTREDASFGVSSLSDHPIGAQYEQPIARGGTMLLDSPADRGGAHVRTEEAMPAAAQRGGFTGTMLIDRRTVDVAELIEREKLERAAAAKRAPRVKREAVEETQRLEDLCHRIKVARQPICPINGLMTLFSFEGVRNRQCNLQLAARRDVETIQQQLEIRCPAIALVTEMQSEPGFFELVRRVGPDVAKTSRFGKGVKDQQLWSITSRDYMDAIAYQACGAFEDWTYKLFQEPGGLAEKGNAKLYTLLSHFRGDARDRLANILKDAFSQDGDGSLSPLLFGGCYFAATGDTQDQQSFVQGVFHRFLDTRSEELAEELDWAESIRKRERFYEGLVNGAMGLSAVLFIAAIVLLIFLFMQGSG